MPNNNDRLTAVSMHPLIKFKVVGYRVDNVDGAITQKKPKPLPVEARREYHIGIIYDHVPKYEGVLYEFVTVPGANLDEEYLKLYRASAYSNQYNFCIHMLHNCEYCTHSKMNEMIDERKAPSA